MASQTATVASDAGAYAELIVDGETGAVVPAGDGSALTQAIEPYLADPARAAAHGLNGLAHVRTHFAIEREAAALSTSMPHFSTGGGRRLRTKRRPSTDPGGGGETIFDCPA